MILAVSGEPQFYIGYLRPIITSKLETACLPQGNLDMISSLPSNTHSKRTEARTQKQKKYP